MSLERGQKFLDSRRDWIVQTLLRLNARLDQVVAADDHSEPTEELRRRALAVLPDRCRTLAAKHKMSVGRVAVRSARTRWGSCSSHNDISLSLYLVALPDELIDFVILHELCHTVYKDHSVNFHSLLDKLTNGREKELDALLRHYRPC